MGKSISQVLTLVILILACTFSFMIRQFATVINEPIIHEFDPQFNWRCAQYIDKHGFHDFFGWFDNASWYPQGRPVGETSYPGLMFTSVLVKWALDKLHIFIDLLQICVYIGPASSVGSVLVAFFFGKLIESTKLGLIYAVLTASVAGMVSRTMGGSYDYECVSLFIIVLCFFTFAKALKNGSLFWSLISGITYGYLALTWGGYVFVANCIPLYACALIALGQYSFRLHISYSLWAIVGTILTAGIPFISDKIVKKPEHFAMIGTFVVMQIWGFFSVLYKFVSKKSYTTILISSIMTLPLFLFAVVTIGMSTGLLGGFSGRLMQMFDPSYASKKIPIIASVAEHQPTAWGRYFLDCGLYILLFPVGVYVVLVEYARKKKFNETKLLVVIFGMSTFYFASIMVRLVLVFTPAMVLISGLGIHYVLELCAKNYKKPVSFVTTASLFGVCVYSVLHTVYFSCYSFSGDHIHFPVLTPRGYESSDDYRDGYRWLWSNTNKDDRIMSWWDYGYQISAMGGRGCMADGNTNNFTHIGIIGMTMSSPEAVSWRLARMMDADYMFVIFGGASGYSGDDINKFLWMPRIANQTFHNISGSMYQMTPYSPSVGNQITKNMSNSMLFKFCYYNFKKFQLAPSRPKGTDYVRQLKVPEIDNIKMNLFQEAYSSSNWIVRIYRVLPDPIWNRVY